VALPSEAGLARNPRFHLNAIKVGADLRVCPGRTRRFAPTTPEYVGFGRGRPACLPLTKVALRFHLGLFTFSG